MLSVFWADTAPASESSIRNRNRIFISRLIIAEFRTPDRRDLFHHFAVTVTAILVEPRRDLRKTQVVLHHEVHRVLQGVITFRIVKLVLDKIEKLTDGMLLRRQAFNKRFQ